MNNFLNSIIAAIKALPAKGRKNGMKILSLGVGLSVSLVLLTKVWFEQTYDNFYEGADRIYYLSEHFAMNGQELVYNRTSGGIAPRMKEYYPQVELATRATAYSYNTKVMQRGNDRKSSVDLVYLADSCFFKLLNRTCLAGDLTESLSIKGKAVVSASLAMKMAESRNAMEAASDVMGRDFKIDDSNGEWLTVAGVYEDFPANSSYRPDVVVSLPSIGYLGLYDGTDGVMGNDRYLTLIRLSKESDIHDIQTGMPEFLERYLPMDEMKEAGFEGEYLARPYQNFHNEDRDMGSMMLVLVLVAVALLMTSVLNYILIVVSTSVNRSREMALRKCFGSSKWNLYGMMAAESLVHTLLAVILAVALIYAFSGTVENLSGTAVSSLFSGSPLFIALGVVLLVMIINAVVPAELFERIPVAVIFRNLRASKRIWKLGLLGVEFCAVAFLGLLLTVITLQYNRMVTSDLGFDSDHTAFVSLSGLSGSQKKTLVDELRQQAEVEDATLCHQSPFAGYSGNSVSLPGEDAQIFNTSDAYWTDGHWFNVLGVKIVKGSPFTEGRMINEEVLIDTNFEEQLKINTGWDDVLGKEIQITEHSYGNSTSVITGVFEPTSQGLVENAEYSTVKKPMAIFYQNPENDSNPFGGLIIRYHQITPEALALTQKICERIVPDKELDISLLHNERLNDLKDTLNVRNSILIGGLVTLLIAIIGLIGYTIDEVKRRSKEIAIRRVSGAMFSEIRAIFIKDILLIAVPCTLMGCILASMAVNRWEQQFVVQVGLPIWVFMLTFILTIALICIISDIYVCIVAGSNPADSLKTE